NAGIRIEHRIRQDRARRVLHQRSRHRARAPLHLRPLHAEDAHLRRPRGHGIRHSAVAYAEILQALWQPAVGARDQVPPAVSVRLRCPCRLGSEAVLPAYIIGMVLAGTVGRDHMLIRRLRTLTFGFLTPFYFIRAGSFVSIPALIAAPFAFVLLLLVKMFTKFVGVFPVTRAHKTPQQEAMYTTLLMSTGLTFGSISSLFGLSHHIIDQGQYSIL